MPDDAHASVTLVLHADHRVEEIDLANVTAMRGAPGADVRLVWTSARNPDHAEVARLAEAFGLHELAFEDLRRRGQRPKLDRYEGQFMLVAYEAVDADDPDVSEIHFFVGHGWLLSVHWSPTPAVDEARARFRSSANEDTDTVGELLYVLLDAAVDSYFPVLDAMSERIDALEDRVLSGDTDSDSLRDILALKRDLLELRRVLAPMREVANALLRHDLPIVREGSLPYYQDLYDHIVRVLDQVDVYRDLLATVLDARLAAVSNNLNTIMKRLTAFTVVLMVPTLIAGIYGMNFDVMPELHWTFGYPFALAAMLIAGAAAVTFFWRRGWF